MATASSLGHGGAVNAYDSVAASATDSVLVAAGTGRIIVYAVILNQGDTTPSTVTFNSKGAGAGTAVTPALKAGANGVVALPYSDKGWFGTLDGQALTVTTGAGSTTGIIVQYARTTY